MRIVFFGSPAFAAQSLSVLHNSGIEIAAVVTAADKPSGRGLKLCPTEVKQFAEKNNLVILQPESLKDKDFIDKLESFSAELFVVVAFRMLPSEVFSMPSKGTINLHASLLPQYRGATPINWAIINGEKTTGLTTFFIEKEIDTGNIIDFEEIPIENDYTFGVLHDIMMERGSLLLLKTVKSILSNNYQCITQKELIISGEELKKAPKLRKESCRINWTNKVEFIHNQIRGLNPAPSAWTVFRNIDSGKEISVKIHKSEIIDGRHSNETGKFFSDEKNYLYVTCDGGLLSIMELQPEGKKILNISDFLKGFRQILAWEPVNAGNNL